MPRFTRLMKTPGSCVPTGVSPVAGAKAASCCLAADSVAEGWTVGTLVYLLWHNVTLMRAGNPWRRNEPCAVVFGFQKQWRKNKSRETARLCSV